MAAARLMHEFVLLAASHKLGCSWLAVLLNAVEGADDDPHDVVSRDVSTFEVKTSRCISRKLPSI